jgi:hypothetical protein
MKNMLSFKRDCYIFHAFGPKLRKLKNPYKQHSILPRKVTHMALIRIAEVLCLSLGHGTFYSNCSFHVIPEPFKIP